jgi:hypothetical protein
MRSHRKTAGSRLALLTAVCFGVALGAQAQTLTHRYSFQDAPGSTTFADSVGGATFNGQVQGNAQLTGSSLVLDGVNSDYGSLPSGMISNYPAVSLELWVDYGSNANWTRTVAFGTENNVGPSTLDYTHLAPGNYQNLSYSTPSGGGYVNNSGGLDMTSNVHLTIIVNPANGTLAYYNGTTKISGGLNGGGSVPPLSTLNDQFGLLGRSLYDVDPGLNATFHEFRIYSGAVTPTTIALNDAAGPGNYVTSPGTPVSLNFSSPLNPLMVNQSVQQNLTGNFTAVTNLNLVLYGGVTYTSGNTNILTVSSNGVVKGVAVGTTTVVATYGSVSATNSLTVIALPTTLVHRYGFTNDATDSVGGANGTLQGDATVSGGQLVLDGGGYLSLPGNIINISTNAAVTFEAWTTIGQTAQWSHLYEFGDSTVSNIYCAPRADAGGFHSFGVSEGGGVVGGQTLSWAHGWSNITLHITGVVDPTTGTLAVYTNGVLQNASYSATAPLTYIGTNIAYLGKSSYGDPNATLSVNEFRIYSGGLTPAQVAMSDLSGPDSANFNPGTLNSITLMATNYPAFSALVAPVIFANYSALGNFNMLPNVYARINGLTITSSDTNIVSVNGVNMLTTYRPGTVTLTATYLGQTSSAVVRIANQSLLTHRYSFSNDASDSVGGANGTLVGSAAVSGGQVQLDGNKADYVSLPPGLLATYRSATMDIWATINSGQGAWARLFEFADIGPATANELYFAPAWNPGANATFFSDGVPFGGANIGPFGPATTGLTVHLTCLVGDGTMDLYTNGTFWETATISAPVTQVGTGGSWIGYSPYGDPGINGSVDEYRIYKGRLSPEEILASDVLGPNATLSTSATLTAMQGSGSVTLTWPVANAGFAVEVSTNLAATNGWVTLTNAPTLVGSQWTLSLSTSGSPQYYRLIR